MAPETEREKNRKVCSFLFFAACPFLSLPFSPFPPRFPFPNIKAGGEGFRVKKEIFVEGLPGEI